MRVDDNRGGAIREYRIMVITGGFQPFDVSSILTTRSNMYTSDLKSDDFGHAGSSPAQGTKIKIEDVI